MPDVVLAILVCFCLVQSDSNVADILVCILGAKAFSADVLLAKEGGSDRLCILFSNDLESIPEWCVHKGTD